MDLSKLKKYIDNFTEVPFTEWTYFVTLLKLKKFKKGEMIFTQGEDCDLLTFIISGVAATYYTDTSGKVAYKDFVTEGRPIASYSALLLEKNCFFSATAITDIWGVSIKYSDLKKLFSRHSCWEKFGRKAVEKVYIERERREYELLMLSSLQRYQAFREKFEGLVDTIPQWMIASYIGVTHVSLSRLLSGKEMPDPGESPFLGPVR